MINTQTSATSFRIRRRIGDHNYLAAVYRYPPGGRAARPAGLLVVVSRRRCAASAWLGLFSLRFPAPLIVIRDANAALDNEHAMPSAARTSAAVTAGLFLERWMTLATS